MSERPEGVPEDAEGQTWWVCKARDRDRVYVFSPGGLLVWSDTVSEAKAKGIPIPRPPRTDPWGMGLDEEECRSLVRMEDGGHTRSIWESKLAEALRPVVAEWDEEDGR